MKADKALTSISSSYIDFVDVFFKNLIVKLPEYIKINNYTIKLKKASSHPMDLLNYAKEPVKLEILKIYIKTNLANCFIRSSKSPTSTSIFFIKKANNNF